MIGIYCLASMFFGAAVANMAGAASLDRLIGEKLVSHTGWIAATSCLLIALALSVIALVVGSLP